MFWRKPSKPSKSVKLFDVIVTTLEARRYSMGLAGYAHIPAASIAFRLRNKAPVFRSERELIEWLDKELGREEFSLNEDVMDGSAEACGLKSEWITPKPGWCDDMLNYEIKRAHA